MRAKCAHWAQKSKHKQRQTTSATVGLENVDWGVC